MTTAEQVSSLYASVLNRAADAGGLAFYLDFLGKGGTLSQVEAMMRASPEYQAAHAPDARVTGTNPASGATPTTGALDTTKTAPTSSRSLLIVAALAAGAFLLLRK